MKRNKTAKLVVALAATAALVSACSGDPWRRSRRSGQRATRATASARPRVVQDVEFGTLARRAATAMRRAPTDQGVSDTEIKIGYGDDRGYAKSPGLNKERCPTPSPR